MFIVELLIKIENVCFLKITKLTATTRIKHAKAFFTSFFIIKIKKFECQHTATTKPQKFYLFRFNLRFEEVEQNNVQPNLTLFENQSNYFKNTKISHKILGYVFLNDEMQGRERR